MQNGADLGRDLMDDSEAIFKKYQENNHLTFRKFQKYFDEMKFNKTSNEIDEYIYEQYYKRNCCTSCLGKCFKKLFRKVRMK